MDSCFAARAGGEAGEPPGRGKSAAAQAEGLPGAKTSGKTDIKTLEGRLERLF